MKCEPILEPRVPVDDLPEMILKVRLEFDDLRKMLGRNDVIGATWFETHEIYIDQSLDPTDHPRKRGRYRFTVGHEIGHWVLHRRYVPDRAAQLTIFEDRAPEPSILCRETNKREPAEGPADRFASCLLMPRDLVLKASRERHGQARSLAIRFAEIPSRRGERDCGFLRRGGEDHDESHGVRFCSRVRGVDRGHADSPGEPGPVEKGPGRPTVEFGEGRIGFFVGKHV